MTLIREGMMDAGDGHQLRYAEYGNVNAPAAVVLHGGPGSGCNESMLAWFDLDRQRVILFDQRGSGGSLPGGALQANTTSHLVKDIEHLRKHLGVDRWMVVGGSWGAMLGLAYLGACPGPIDVLVLRGLFLPTRAQLDWFFQSLQALVPQAWADLAAGMSHCERRDVLGALAHRLLDGNAADGLEAATRWARYEDAVMTAMRGLQASASPVTDRTIAKYRLQAHYLTNGCFTTERGLYRGTQGNGVPILCLHGTHDWICPPANALRLHRLVPRTDLRWIPRGTHPASDPLVTDALRRSIAEARSRHQS